MHNFITVAEHEDFVRVGWPSDQTPTYIRGIESLWRRWYIQANPNATDVDEFIASIRYKHELALTDYNSINFKIEQQSIAYKNRMTP
jgi:hypothetical protein